MATRRPRAATIIGATVALALTAAGLASCSGGEEAPASSTAAAPDASSSPSESPSPTKPPAEFRLVDLAGLPNAPHVAGAAAVMDRQSYMFDLSWRVGYTVGKPDTLKAPPGQVDIGLSGSLDATVTNTTEGRQAPASITDWMVLALFPEGGAVCGKGRFEGIGGFGGYCAMPLARLPLNSALAPGEARTVTANPVLQNRVAEAESAAFAAELAAGPSFWVVTEDYIDGFGRDAQGAMLPAGEGCTASDGLTSGTIRWSSAPIDGCAIAVVGAAPESVDHAGAAGGLRGVLGASAPYCPMAADVGRISRGLDGTDVGLGFDASVGANASAPTNPSDAPVLTCSTAEGPGGARLYAGEWTADADALSGDPQRLANWVRNDELGEGEIVVTTAGQMLGGTYQVANWGPVGKRWTLIIWHDDAIYVSGWVGTDLNAAPEDQIARHVAWFDQNLQTMLAGLAGPMP